MKSVTGLDDDDFLYIHYSNDIYQVPFFVAVDKDAQSIVIAIRGTMSLKDTITDMTAQTANVFSRHSETTNDECSLGSDELVDWVAHKGMVNAANFVFDTIQKTQVLQRAMVEYPGYKIVVTGHSLGAGAAVVLSAKLRQRQVELERLMNPQSFGQKNTCNGAPGSRESSFRSTEGGAPLSPPPDALLRQSHIYCYAYSPPGGLCSSTFAKDTLDFVFSIVVGDDLVPRLSMQSLHHLREEILQVLQDCKQPKYRLLAQGCWFMLFGISEKNLRKGKICSYKPVNINSV